MKECFVIMPIGSGAVYATFRNRYKEIIQPAVEGLQAGGQQVFRCVRGDDVPESGSISRDVIRRLACCDVVIADITGLNPNVLYELGVRHSLRSGTILIAEETTVSPFDIYDLRVIRYADRAGGERPAIEKIQAALAAFLEEQEREDSPVNLTVPGIVKKAAGMELVDGVEWKRLENGAIASPIDGQWVEILDRYEGRTKVRHYSIFTFQHDPAGHVHPFLMVGDSYRSNAEHHSHWETRYVQIEKKGKTVAVEYIFSAVVTGADSRRGYGVSRFWPGSGGRIVTGSGQYLAAEEKPTYQCNYRLERIEEPVGDVADFIRRLNARYGSVAAGGGS